MVDFATLQLEFFSSSAKTSTYAAHTIYCKKHTVRLVVKVVLVIIYFSTSYTGVMIQLHPLTIPSSQLVGHLIALVSM